VSGVLIIGDDDRLLIKAMLAAARENATPWSECEPVADGSETNSLMLGERKPGVSALRKKYPALPITLGTYRAAISFEVQPAGLVKHLSVSSRDEGKVCNAFEFTAFPLPPNSGRVWFEEHEPGHMAVNVIEVIK